LILEHILFSISFAILIGVIVERKYGYILPIWIIAACAGLPDIDYIIQTIMYPLLKTIPLITPIFIVHGDFHNIVMLIILSLFFGWVINKYLKTGLNNAIICVFLGSSFHVFCDFLVYNLPFCPIAPRFPCYIYGFGIFKETGSWHGLGEPSIFMWGIIIMIISICIKFYYLDSKWIYDRPAKNEEI